MPVDLQKVRILFENRNNIGETDFLVREIAERLSERLSVMEVAPFRILDAGCGSGKDMERLAGKFTDSLITGLDASFYMLKSASGHLDGTGNGRDRICGDFGKLPFGRGAFDMIWSNLALHWHGDMAAVLREWRRVLKPGGLLIFSCFGEGTWQDLRNIYREIDKYAHIAVFNSMHDIGNRLIEVGFSAPVLERERIAVTYRAVGKMLDDIRAFGGNPLSGRPKGLWGKKKYGQLLDRLNAQRDNEGLLSLNFEVVYAHAFAEDMAVHEWKKVGIFREV